MFLRNLIFGRKPKPQPTRALVGSPDPVTSVAPGFAEAPVADLTARSCPVEERPETAAGTRAIGVLLLDRPATPRPPLAVALRGPRLVAGGPDALADRRQALTEELSSALSLREVALVGTGHTARLTVANRRVLSARFSAAGGARAFDLRRDLAAEAAALALQQALADVLAAPGDLMIDARHGAGVYAADGGVPVDLLVGDAEALRRAFLPPQDGAVSPDLDGDDDLDQDRDDLGADLGQDDYDDEDDRQGVA